MDYTRSNTPSKGYIVGRLLDNRNARFLANHADNETLKQLASMEVEPIGRKGWVWSVAEDDEQGNEKRRNVFSLDLDGKIEKGGNGVEPRARL